MNYGEAIRAIAERTSFRTEEDRNAVLAAIDAEYDPERVDDQAASVEKRLFDLEQAHSDQAASVEQRFVELERAHDDQAASVDRRFSKMAQTDAPAPTPEPEQTPEPEPGTKSGTKSGTRQR